MSNEEKKRSHRDIRSVEKHSLIHSHPHGNDERSGRNASTPRLAADSIVRSDADDAVVAPDLQQYNWRQTPWEIMLTLSVHQGRFDPYTLSRPNLLIASLVDHVPAYRINATCCRSVQQTHRRSTAAQLRLSRLSRAASHSGRSIPYL